MTLTNLLNSVFYLLISGWYTTHYVLLIISDLEEADLGYEPVHYRKVFLDDDVDDPAEKEGGRADEESDEVSSNYQDSHHTEKDCLGDDCHYSDESYQYSDDHENYSEDSEHAADTKEQEAED